MFACTFFKTQHRLAMLAALAVGLQAAAPIARAQDGVEADGNQSAAASANRLSAVIVHPRGHRVHHSYGVPPDRAAVFAAEAAKAEAWRKYRNSAPSSTGGPLELSKDYPGLRSYAPQ